MNGDDDREDHGPTIIHQDSDDDTKQQNSSDDQSPPTMKKVSENNQSDEIDSGLDELKDLNSEGLFINRMIEMAIFLNHNKFISNAISRQLTSSGNGA